jgi:hypothetical protein
VGNETTVSKKGVGERDGFQKKGNGKRTKITDYSTKKGERRLKIALWQQEEFLDNLIIIFKKGIGNKKKKK